MNEEIIAVNRQAFEEAFPKAQAAVRAGDKPLAAALQWICANCLESVLNNLETVPLSPMGQNPWQILAAIRRAFIRDPKMYGEREGGAIRQAMELRAPNVLAELLLIRDILDD